MLHLLLYRWVGCNEMLYRPASKKYQCSEEKSCSTEKNLLWLLLFTDFGSSHTWRHLLCKVACSKERRRVRALSLATTGLTKQALRDRLYTHPAQVTGYTQCPSWQATPGVSADRLHLVVSVIAGEVDVCAIPFSYHHNNQQHSSLSHSVTMTTTSSPEECLSLL